MKQLVEFPLQEGGSVVVEVDDDEPGVDRVARDGVTARAMGTFESALQSVHTIVEKTFTQLGSLVTQPDDLEIELGIRLNAKAGAVIASTDAEGHIRLRLKWRKETST